MQWVSDRPRGRGQESQHPSSTVRPHCQRQALHKDCGEWYITSKRGKDAPSALALEGLAASLIHSLQLHCWKRVQKEDQATRKQPQYLIWLDLAGRLLWLYICSFLTKGTGVSFFSCLYLFYGSPVNFSLYYQNWREALPDGYVEPLPTSDWTQKPPCHMSLSRVSQTCSYREKNTRGRESDAFSCNYRSLFNALQTAAKSNNLLSSHHRLFLTSCPVTFALHNIFTDKTPLWICILLHKTFLHNHLTNILLPATSSGHNGQLEQHHCAAQSRQSSSNGRQILTDGTVGFSPTNPKCLPSHF